jgi:hypothetical protein
MTRLVATTQGGIAAVKVVQTFANPFAETLQVRYLLPLPADAEPKWLASSPPREEDARAVGAFEDQQFGEQRWCALEGGWSGRAA